MEYRLKSKISPCFKYRQNQNQTKQYNFVLLFWQLKIVHANTMKSKYAITQKSFLFTLLGKVLYILKVKFKGLYISKKVALKVVWE